VGSLLASDRGEQRLRVRDVDAVAGLDAVQHSSVVDLSGDDAPIRRDDVTDGASLSTAWTVTRSVA
jgi:hypothetical protein